MASHVLPAAICLCLLFSSNIVLCQPGENGPSSPGEESTTTNAESTDSGASTKPLVKRPSGTTYTTLLGIDGGGARAVVSTIVLIEIEQSIKRYVLENPEYLPADGTITSIDDFDVNLVDFFDCMCGAAAGSWGSMYLASRGGQGHFQAFLDRPQIVERYGAVSAGSAEGLRVFHLEFTDDVYPMSDAVLNPLPVEDLLNPQIPGVNSPSYSSDGMISSLETLFGETTLADLETSVVVYCFDLRDSLVTLFMQNHFRRRPVTSYIKMVPRFGPKEPASDDASSFTPDFEFQEGFNFYLSEVGAASYAVPTFHGAQVVTEVNGDGLEFLLMDGNLAVEATELPTIFIVESEIGATGFDNIAILSVGSGADFRDFVDLANSGAADWVGPLLQLNYLSGKQAQNSLMDYMFYSNPDTEPNQFLRIQTSASRSTKEGEALADTDNPLYADIYEEIGREMADLYQDAIDEFVAKFIFG